MTIEDALVLNYLYEFEAFCTSVVARQADGTVLHGRNLDFAYPDEMRDITYVANFYQNGVHLFDTVMFAGDIGVYTGFKANAFSLSENYRVMDHNVHSFMDNMKYIFEGRK